jgi:hypothetical protein
MASAGILIWCFANTCLNAALYDSLLGSASFIASIKSFKAGTTAWGMFSEI